MEEEAYGKLKSVKLDEAMNKMSSELSDGMRAENLLKSSPPF